MLVLVLAVIAAPSGHALDKEFGLLQLDHDSWLSSTRGGSVSGVRAVRAVASTPDGRLVIGTAYGLLRFDGMRQDRVGDVNGVDFQSNLIQALCVAANGDIWAGFDNGGVSRRSQHELVNHPAGIGLPDGKVMMLDCAADGTVWAATEGGLAQWRGGQWRHVGGGTLPQGRVTGVHVAKDGGIWTVVDGTLHSRANEASAFEAVGHIDARYDSGTPMAESADGSIWVGSRRGLFRVERQGGKPQLKRFHEESVTALLVDRDDALWTGGDGLARFTSMSASSRQLMRQPDGLTSNRVLCLVQDLNGSVWAITDAGMDRFMLTAFIEADAALQFDGSKALATGAAGELWVADREHDRVLVQRNGRVRILAVPTPETAHRGIDGTMWFAGRDGVSQVRADGVVTEPLPRAAQTGDVLALVQDAQGAAWIALHSHGIFRLQGSTWQAGAGVEGLPSGTPTAMERDADGGIWLGYASGHVARVIHGRVQVLDERELSSVGSILVLRALGKRMWIGGARSLAVHDGDTLKPVPSSTCSLLEGITDVQETAGGGLWIYRPFGVAWFRDGVHEALEGRHLKCRMLQNDLNDTPGGKLQLIPGAAPLTATPDGRVWLVAEGKLVWTNAENSSYQVTPPGIGSIRIDLDGARALENEPRFSAGTRNLLLSWEGWDMAAPSTLLYQYRLAGVDQDWRSTGTLATAYFANLKPGAYRFEVRARTTGEWGAPASRSFAILPYLHETLWFRALLAATAIAMLGLLFRMQLRRAAARARERLEERLLERERIARELHDTLLQGVQGLLLRFQVVAARIPGNVEAASMMEDVLNRADQVMAESRERVAELREIPPNTSELPGAIADLGPMLANGRAVSISNVVQGEVRALDGSVNSELFLIAREAIGNALRHSGCTSLETTLSYERFWLRLRVRDDGCGIPDDILRQGRNGHFGLNGMRERAQRLRGTLRIASTDSEGTEIEVRIPAALAYAREKTS